MYYSRIQWVGAGVSVIAFICVAFAFLLVPPTVFGSSIFTYATATTSTSDFGTSASGLCYRINIPLNVATVDGVSFWAQKNTSVVNSPFTIGVLAGSEYTRFDNQIASSSITTTAKLFTATTSSISLSITAPNYLIFCKDYFESSKYYRLKGDGTVFPFIFGQTGLGTTTSTMTSVSVVSFSPAITLSGSLLSVSLTNGSTSDSVIDMASTTEAIYIGFSSLQLYLAFILLILFGFLSFRFISKYI